MVPLSSTQSLLYFYTLRGISLSLENTPTRITTGLYNPYHADHTVSGNI